jgi:hypothetical protein
VLGRSQTLFQLLAHSRRGCQFRPALEEALPQSIAFAHHGLGSATQLFRMVFMLFGRFFGVLTSLIDLDELVALSRGMALLDVAALCLVSRGGSIELDAPVDTLRLKALNPGPQTSTLRVAFLDSVLAAPGHHAAASAPPLSPCAFPFAASLDVRPDFTLSL